MPILGPGLLKGWQGEHGGIPNCQGSVTAIMVISMCVLRFVDPGHDCCVLCFVEVQVCSFPPLFPLVC